MDLLNIKPFLDSLVNTISQVIHLEITILSTEFVRVSSTGEYYRLEKQQTSKILMELNEDFGTKRVLSTGLPFVSTDFKKDFPHLTERQEKAIILYPVHADSRLSGVVGFIALNQEQQEQLAHNAGQLLNFSRELSKIISTKLAEAQKTEENNLINSQISAIIENFDCGMMLIDQSMSIRQINSPAAKMLSGTKARLLNTSLNHPSIRALLLRSMAMNYPDEQKISMRSDMDLLVQVKPITSNKSKYALVSLEQVSAIREKISLVNNDPQLLSIDSLYGKSPQISQIRQRILQTAMYDSTILITGESGTGKEVAANIIHSLSDRRERPMISINCAAIPEHLIESELFGYEEGAFSGAPRGAKPGKFILANGSTLFLDEIADMPMSVQTKLLRVLQEKKVDRIGSSRPVDIDIRILAATNRDLSQLMSDGKFRHDLYYRINVIPIELPPLRDRKEDIPIFLEKFIHEFSGKFYKRILGVSAEAMQCIMAYDWPGNVRELRNCAEYMINFETTEYLGLNSLPRKLIQEFPVCGNQAALKERMLEYEQKLLSEAISSYPLPLKEKHVAQLCSVLGLSRASFYRKYKALKLPERECLKGLH